MHQSVVSAGPDHSFLLRRFCERKNRVVIFDRSDVVRERTAARLLFALVVAGEVAADLRPALAVIGRSKNAFGAGVNRVGIMRRKDEWRDPLETMNEIDRAVAGVVHRPDTDVLILLLRFVVADDVSLAVGINDVPVARIGQNETAFAAAGLKPIFAPDHTRVSPARDADVRVVLLRAVDVIRKRVVDRDVIKLRGRLIVLGRPGLAAIGRDAGAAIVRIRKALRIIGIDPEPMMIAVPRRKERE